LPEADFVSIGILDAPEHTGCFSLTLFRTRAFVLQYFQRVLDIIDSEAEARVSSAPQSARVRRRNKFEENTIDIEASDIVSRDEPESKYVPIETDCPFHVGDIVRHAIKLEFHV
jgi:hypothetical protein